MVTISSQVRETKRPKEDITLGQYVFSLTCSQVGGVWWWAKSRIWIWVAALIKGPQRRECCGSKVTFNCLCWHCPFTYYQISILWQRNDVYKRNFIRTAGTVYHILCNLVWLRTPCCDPWSYMFPVLWFVHSWLSFWTFYYWPLCLCSKDWDKYETIGNRDGFQAFLWLLTPNTQPVLIQSHYLSLPKIWYPSLKILCPPQLSPFPPL